MIIARRYASAIYREAERQSKTDAVVRDMELLNESLRGSRELVSFFKSPVISREKKEAVVQSLFQKRIDPLTLKFLHLLIAKQREDVLPEIVQAFRDLRDQQLGIVEAEARVAEAMPDAEHQKLSDALSRLTGKKVRLKVREDGSLIGGVVIRVGDTVYDGSIRHNLERLREQMEAGSYRLN